MVDDVLLVILFRHHLCYVHHVVTFWIYGDLLICLYVYMSIQHERTRRMSMTGGKSGDVDFWRRMLISI